MARSGSRWGSCCCGTRSGPPWGHTAAATSTAAVAATVPRSRGAAASACLRLSRWRGCPTSPSFGTGTVTARVMRCPTPPGLHRAGTAAAHSHAAPGQTVPPGRSGAVVGAACTWARRRVIRCRPVALVRAVQLELPRGGSPKCSAVAELTKPPHKTQPTRSSDYSWQRRVVAVTVRSRVRGDHPGLRKVVPIPTPDRIGRHPGFKAHRPGSNPNPLWHHGLKSPREQIKAFFLKKNDDFAITGITGSE